MYLTRPCGSRNALTLAEIQTAQHRTDEVGGAGVRVAPLGAERQGPLRERLGVGVPAFEQRDRRGEDRRHRQLEREAQLLGDVGERTGRADPARSIAELWLAS